MLRAQISSHAASAQARASGWLIGGIDDCGNAVPLSLLRCTHTTTDGLPDWTAEKADLSNWVPHGLAVVGWYVVGCTASELGTLIKTYAAPIIDVIDSRLRTPAVNGGPVFASMTTAEDDICFFSSTELERGTLKPVERLDYEDDAIRTALQEDYVVLRARPLVQLHVHCCSDVDDSTWADAHRAASATAIDQLRSLRVCFMIPQANHIGIVSIADTSQPPAPLASGMAGQVRCSSHSKSGEPDDAEAEEEEVEECVDSGTAEKRTTRKPSGGKKGGKKGAGGKKGGLRKAAGGSGSADGFSSNAVATETQPNGDAPPAAGDPWMVQVLWPQSPQHSCSRHPAPALSLLTCDSATDLVSIPLQLDALVYARRDAPLRAALVELQLALAAQAHSLATLHLAAAPSAASAHSVRASGYAFQPPQLPLFHCMAYVLPAGDASEPSLREQRKTAHFRLGLPLNQPLLRTSNALVGSLGGEAARGGGSIPGILRDVHVGLGPSGLKNGRVSLVQGSYEYFHYMQWTGHGQSGYTKPYDDCGWGCAYRSLMSLISWFRLQGYTTYANPTHYEIQKVLVEHCGQDPSTLLGKKMWLGSQDLSYFLEYALGVTCRTEVFHSGDDVSSGGRKLAHHFDTEGTPIMCAAYPECALPYEEPNYGCRSYYHAARSMSDCRVMTMIGIAGSAVASWRLLCLALILTKSLGMPVT